ncbi:MAG: dihydroorotate dehydrogenase-like protein [Chloroflexi bacterium]|nr:MAG: dihydroorotate dehydrogenase-like protein [Chloroflexota bacterium]MBL1195716.1 dihydroorotate dehydrogenase-like protein [Chloroflexota bacterium]NOH13004.1 dihydroorotate dehydrogenase-like protein [Chloroflexota bacterium]
MLDIDLTTTYMGLTLKNPLVVSSSRITGNLKGIVNCAKSGAGAIVLKSLFEEQFLADEGRLMDQDEAYFWFPEAIDFINTHAKDHGLAEYITLIQQAKEQTEVPIIGSIHCMSPNEWPRFAAELEGAGIDGLELNIAIIPFDENVASQDIEDTYVEIVTEVKKHVSVPLAVKISPMFTNIISIVKRLEAAGADAVVLFNRFYRPDIDIVNERVIRNQVFSGPEEMTQSLRWISLLSNRVDCDVVANTGIHDTESIIKHLLVGATATQICSILYKNGVNHIENMLTDLESWLKKRNYATIEQFQGKITRNIENIAAFERVQYMQKTLTE